MTEYEVPWPLFLIYGMIALIWLEAAGDLPEPQQPLTYNGYS